MSKFAFLFSVPLLFLSIGATTPAQQLTVQIDPQTTEIHFKLGATMHTVKGDATVESGNFSIDTATQKLEGALVVPAAGLKTHNKDRDHNMYVDVLETEKFPNIVLKLERYEGTLAREGVSQVTLHATMQIHGVEKPLQFPTEVKIDGKTFTAKGDFDVPYVEWGMRDPSNFVLRVSKKVQVRLFVSGQLQ